MSVTLRSVSPLWRLIRSKQRESGVLNFSLCLSNTSLYPTCRLKLGKQALMFCKSKCINVEGSKACQTHLSSGGNLWKVVKMELFQNNEQDLKSNAFWTESRARSQGGNSPLEGRKRHITLLLSPSLAFIKI